MNVNAALVREINTEVLFVLDVGFLVFAALYFRRKLIEATLWALRQTMGWKAAIAISTHILGLCIIRGWGVSMYWMTSHGLDPAPIEDAYYVSAGGLVIASIGMGCCIRVFAPSNLKHWSWIMVYTVAFLFVAYMHLSDVTRFWSMFQSPPFLGDEPYPQ